MEFKDRVKSLRKQLFITQKQLGKELGCTRQTVNRWENGLVPQSFILEAKFEKICADRNIKFDGTNS